MLEKLNNLEQANRTLVNFSQSLSNVQSKVDSIDKRSSDHELFFRVLAYKSIDMEARSRRRNLLFHGLAEVKNERCCELIKRKQSGGGGGGGPNTDRNVSVNSTASREQRTYTQL